MLDELPGEISRCTPAASSSKNGVEGMLAKRAHRGDGVLARVRDSYLSRVDAGTIEFMRRVGIAVVSSGDLVGRFEAAWDAAARSRPIGRR